MRRARGLRRGNAAGIALVLAAALAAPAEARKFQMSGTWLVRQGQAFVPLQFGGSAGGTQMTHRSTGSWTEAPLSPPGQVVSDVGGVTATGSGPATLRIPRHRWKGDHSLLIPLSFLLQITTMLQVDAPYETATFRAGAGPGSFTWCPANPACTLAGAIPGGAPVGNNGRVVYTAGANQFGGTMQLGLRGGGLVSIAHGGGRVGHRVFFGSGPTLRKLAVGGGANDAPTIQKVYLPRGYVTAPTMIQPMGSLILYPGPFVTTMLGNTLTMPSGVKLKLLPAVTPLMTMTGEYTTREAFAHTTGTVLAQQVTGTGGDDFFSVMGSDARTPLGAGNLNTVAGGLARRSFRDNMGILRHTRSAEFDKVFLSLGLPVPSMSPVGAAAAALLMLLAVGYALRRRLWEGFRG